MRISYSIAAAWWEGRQAEAIAMLNHEDIEFPSYMERAMGYGSGAHRAWEEETKITDKLPVIFKVPQANVLHQELKIVRKLPSGDELVGKIDVAFNMPEGKRGMVCIGDYKTGAGHNQWQVPVYHFLTYNRLNPKQFWYFNFDKLTGQTTNEIVKLSYPATDEEWALPEETTYTKGYNWIMTVIQDIKAQVGDVYDRK